MSAPRILQRINRDGNAFPYSTELVDDWTPDGASKDCDSYASWKMLRCLEAGIPSDHMAIATCWVNGDYEDGYHAVLLVYLDGKVWCLDNRSFWVERLDYFQRNGAPGDRKGYDFDLVPRYMQDLIND